MRRGDIEGISLLDFSYFKLIFCYNAIAKSYLTELTMNIKYVFNIMEHIKETCIAIILSIFN